MRTIKFRAQKTTNEVWVYGSLVYSNELAAAIYYQVGNGSVKSMEWVYVKPDTIGQFTGLYDKNGKEIYEGDIVRVLVSRLNATKNKRYMNFPVSYNTLFGCFWATNGCPISLSDTYCIEVIGNIHDNPKLLENEKD